MKRTPGGRRIFGEIMDDDGHEVSVVESSARDSGPRCWIFGGNPHLTPAQARRVANALLKFADWAQPRKAKQ